MNARAVSLPDLASDAKRGKPLSLSEGFAGANRNATLASSAFNFAPRGGAYAGDDGTAKSRLNAVLPIYYRTRQLVLEQEKKRMRAPQRLLADLKAQEKAVGQELRPLHPLFFQRFDDVQLDRLLRSMPILKLSKGRWIFGAEGLAEPWPDSDGERAFILLYGRVMLFADPSGSGERQEITRCAVFGEKRFHIGDETVRDKSAGAAYCEEPCVVGCLSAKVLQTAYADRAFGNKRIAQLTKTVPAFSRITQQEINIDMAGAESVEELEKKKQAAKDASNAILSALGDLSKIATVLHIRPGQEVLTEDPLEENLFIVAKGGLDVRGDVRLVEKLDSLPPRKTRIRVYVDKAKNLYGDSWLDKLDPYCAVRIGEYKKFQTPVLWNVGPNPKFDYNGALTYNNEAEIEFAVYNHNRIRADELCGQGSLMLKDIPDGWSGPIELFRHKAGLFQGNDVLDEPAGRIWVTINYDYEKVNALIKTPKERSWSDLTLFNIKQNEVWGHEQLMLGYMFRRTLEAGSNSLRYRLFLGDLRVYASRPRGEQEATVCWKVSKKRFLEFTKHCGREKQFMQSCRVDSLQKQTQIRDKMSSLIRRWEQELMSTFIRSAEFMNPPKDEESIDPNLFRVAYRGVKAHIHVRNAVNLVGGSFFDKLDPYVKVKFKGGKDEFKTGFLQDAGSDPVWDSEGSITYQGEQLLEIKVYDYDRYSAHDLIAEGVLPVDKFGSINGFEGTINLSLPGNKRKKSTKQMVIILGILWDAPRDPNANATTTTSGAQRLMNSTL